MVKLCFISMTLWVHTAILSIRAHEFKVPEKSYNIRDFVPCIRPWSYKRVVLCSGKTVALELFFCVAGITYKNYIMLQMNVYWMHLVTLSISPED